MVEVEASRGIRRNNKPGEWMPGRNDVDLLTSVRRLLQVFFWSFGYVWSVNQRILSFERRASSLRVVLTHVSSVTT